ncbi:MAG: DUF924 domain-containing protein [Proteobacteria bacterium]|nr:DUF924 domain-containing protein [Pseudomonadota bacterium]
MHYQQVIAFWFEEIDPKKWWKKDQAFDQLIKDRFGDLHRSAARCELSAWRREPAGRLAEIIVLDQFSRNIFRGLPQAFAQDALALVLAQEALTHKADQAVDSDQRSFFYMPFMHSESAAIHEQAVSLFTGKGMESSLDYELRHKAIIDKFGRYPHRNEILGRESTAEELEFLKQPGSSF